MNVENGRTRGRATGRLLLVGALLLPLWACASSDAERAGHAPELSAGTEVPSSKRLEKELQSLDWAQFQTVLAGIPKLKAQVDAYGPLGWKYVEQNYRSYGWKKNIDKLDASQKVELFERIQRARAAVAE
jgi:hypothetical protein